jgi:hypothetical protein
MLAGSRLFAVSGRCLLCRSSPHDDVFVICGVSCQTGVDELPKADIEIVAGSDVAGYNVVVETCAHCRFSVTAATYVVGEPALPNY